MSANNYRKTTLRYYSRTHIVHFALQCAVFMFQRLQVVLKALDSLFVDPFFVCKNLLQFFDLVLRFLHSTFQRRDFDFQFLFFPLTFFDELILVTQNSLLLLDFLISNALR